MQVAEAVKGYSLSAEPASWLQRGRTVRNTVSRVWLTAGSQAGAAGRVHWTQKWRTKNYCSSACSCFSILELSIFLLAPLDLSYKSPFPHDLHVLPVPHSLWMSRPLIVLILSFHYLSDKSHFCISERFFCAILNYLYVHYSLQAVTLVLLVTLFL